MTVALTNSYRHPFDDRLYIGTPKLAVSLTIAYVASAIFFYAYEQNGYALGTALIAAAFVVTAATKWKHLISYFAHAKLGIPYTPRLNHPDVFTPRELCQSRLAYRLVTLEQEIPVFVLADSNQLTMGWRQGELMAQVIWKLSMQTFPLMFSQAAKKARDTQQACLRQSVENYHFTMDETSEIEGVVAGYGEWKRRKGLQNPELDMTIFWKKAHVITDVYKSNPFKFDGTVIVAKDPETGEFVAARSLDGESLGVLGESLYFKVSKTTSLEECFHTFPGFIGGLTGFNNRQLIAFVNELGTVTHPSGTPYQLYMHRLVNICATVDAVEKMIVYWQESHDLWCASSCILTVVDKTTAALFYFYPTEPVEAQLTHIGQGVYKKDIQNGPLIVTNRPFIKGYIENSLSNSSAQKQVTRLTFEEKITELLKGATLSSTIAVYIFNQTNRTFKVGNDNYNAGALIPKLKPISYLI